ncbi:hydrocarbon degradation protein [uncultured Porphyromonas sp.]|mgnify:FL=1|uniref:hydrocarbon degradation protein n=1 Tax=uncultured Porphyromonas sp. TaxID=159274 RepID=UPI002628E0C8|nr:hydrocarbon degradation protein [uncultured Porphyromonas sp.]
MLRHYFIPLISSALLLITGSYLSAQTHDNALRFSTETLDGTARYQAMGGAFGAVGADYSSLRQNPAGLGLFRSNEIQGTIAFGQNLDQATWYEEQYKKGHTAFSGNMSVVLATPLRGSGLTFNLALGFYQRQSFARTFDVSNHQVTKFSLADFAAFITPTNVSSDDLLGKNAYGSVPAPWLAILGHGAGWTVQRPEGFYESAFNYSDKGGLLGPSNSQLRVNERGGIQDFDFNFGLNYSDRLYFGLGVKISALDYRMNSYYGEDFIDKDYLELANELRTSGSGASVSFGMIARVSDHLRLGAAIQTPTWFTLQDNYVASAESRYSRALDSEGKPLPEKDWTVKDQTPGDAAWRYQLQTPTKIVLSGAFVGRRGMLSLDYELANYTGIQLKDTYGPFDNDNKLMKDYFTPMQSTLRLGGELRISPQFSLRAGGYWRQAPMKANFDSDPKQSATIPVNEAGTVPHYEIVGMGYGVTGGLGWRFSPSSYLDLAVVYQGQKSHMYPFPTRYYGDNGEQLTTPQAIQLQKHRIYGVATFGFKF